MLKQYNSIVKFMIAENAMLGYEGAEQRIANQLQHVIAAIKRIPLDHDDAQQLLERLHEESLFSRDQRREIAKVVSTLTHTHDTSSPNGKTQSLRYIHNYLPEYLWTILFDKSISFDHKLDELAKFAVPVLGCRFPDPPSRRHMVAFVAATSNTRVSADQIYANVFALKDKFKHKRDIYPGSITFNTFPADVAAFIQLHPTAYTTAHPPVPSRITTSSILDIETEGACRSTSKRLSAKTKHQAASDINPLTSQASIPLMQCMMQYMLRGAGVGSGDDANPGHITIHRDRASRAGRVDVVAPPIRPPAPACYGAPTTAALPDKEYDAPDEHSTSTDPTDPFGLDAMEASVKGIMNKRGKTVGTASVVGVKHVGNVDAVTHKSKKGATSATAAGATKVAPEPKKMSKAKKAKLAAIAAADVPEQSDTDDDDDDHDHAVIAKPKKVVPMKAKDKAVMKSKSLKGAKKVDAKAMKVKLDVVHDVRPDLALTPTAYLGGKIYYTNRGGFGSFRCYLRKHDKVEKTIRIEKNGIKAQRAAWLSCLTAIEADPRPHVA